MTELHTLYLLQSLTVPNRTTSAWQLSKLLKASLTWFFFYRTHPSNWPPMLIFSFLSLVLILYHECISGFLYSAYTWYVTPGSAWGGEDMITLASDPNTDTFLASPLPSPPPGASWANLSAGGRREDCECDILGTQQSTTVISQSR